MKTFPDIAWKSQAVFALISLSIFSSAFAQTLPTGVTTVPFYDTSKVGLSFYKDQLSTSNMQQVPGKPYHFLVLGYFGYLWTLYPDTTKPDTVIPGTAISVKQYTRTQVADWTHKVLKAWEQGAVGLAFDPNFAVNRRIYVQYQHNSDSATWNTPNLPPAQAQAARTGIDIINNASNETVVDRYVMSQDYNTVTYDARIMTMEHGTGYGAGNIAFGKDHYLYVVTSNYNRNSWDSTDYNRKIMRIDVSGAPDSGRMYRIPNDNPWFNAANPNVKKETWAFGIRNAWSIGMNYLTGAMLVAEVGEERWEEINIVEKGKNYGWGDGGGQSTTSKQGSGVEGPCHENTITGAAYARTTGNSGAFTRAYSYTGPFSFGNTMTCADFTNGAWNFSRTGQNVTVPAANGLPEAIIPTSLPGTNNSCIAVSPAFRGSPSSPFYGYHFITDVQRNYFLAVKQGTGITPHTVPQNVGELATGGPIRTNLPNGHDGIVNFPEDSYGNMYTILLSSRNGGGSSNWHDIYRMSHPDLTPAAIPNDIYGPVGINRVGSPERAKGKVMITGYTRGSRLRIPDGFSGVDLYNLSGRKVWSYRGTDIDVHVPGNLGNGILQARFLP